MRIDRIEWGTTASPVGLGPNLKGLPIAELPTVSGAEGCTGPWVRILLRPSLRLRLGACHTLRKIPPHASDGAHWYAYPDPFGQVSLIAVLWQHHEALDPADLLLALEDRTGTLTDALTQPWRCAVLQSSRTPEVPEPILSSLLSPYGLACIGQEASEFALGEIEVHLTSG